MVVEAALTMTTLFVFLLGIMEAGRFFQVQQFLTDAAHEGARLGVRSLTGRNYNSYLNKDDITIAVRNFLSDAGVQVNTADVTVDCLNLVTGSTIQAGAACTSGCPDVNTPCATRVAVSMQYKVLTLSMFTKLEIPIRGKALMRNETPY